MTDQKEFCANNDEVQEAIVQDVKMDIMGSGALTPKIEAAIVEYMALRLAHKQAIYCSHLLQIAIECGAKSAVLSMPEFDIIPTSHQTIRLGNVKVNDTSISFKAG